MNEMEPKDISARLRSAVTNIGTSVHVTPTSDITATLNEEPSVRATRGAFGKLPKVRKGSYMSCRGRGNGSERADGKWASPFAQFLASRTV